jgi:hypothetical protein
MAIKSLLDGIQKVSACLLASPAGLGAHAAVLVQRGVPLALVSADLADVGAGIDQRSDGDRIERSLASYDARRSTAYVCAIQTQSDAFEQVMKVLLA